MEHIYQDLERITGQKGLMTHMLPRVHQAVEPWLRKYVKDDRFWDNKHDTTHCGEIELPEPTPAELQDMEERFLSLPNPLTNTNTK